MSPELQWRDAVLTGGVGHLLWLRTPNSAREPTRARCTDTRAQGPRRHLRRASPLLPSTPGAGAGSLKAVRRWWYSEPSSMLAALVILLYR